MNNELKEDGLLDKSFGKEQRLKKSSEFERVYKLRCSARNAFLLVFCAPNQLNRSRLGLSVSKKVGSSPTRNQWKRLIREAFRCHCNTLLPQGFDFVMIPMVSSSVPSLSDITNAVIHLTGQVVRKYNNKRENDNH